MSAAYAHPEVLVNTDWVASHGKDANVRVVEVDVDTKAYDESHVPGAIAWAWNTQLCDTVVRDIAPKAAFEALLTESGIGNDTTVVLYGDNNNWFAAWAFWQMKIYGHQDVRIMDGGRKKWLAEGRDLDTDAAKPTPSAKPYQATKPDYSLRAFLPQVQQDIGLLKEQEAFIDIAYASARRPDAGSSWWDERTLIALAGSPQFGADSRDAFGKLSRRRSRTAEFLFLYNC